MTKHNKIAKNFKVKWQLILNMNKTYNSISTEQKVAGVYLYQ